MRYIKIDGISSEILVERKTTKSIKYKVYPDLKIKVIAPKEISDKILTDKIEKKKLWFKKSLDFYSQIAYSQAQNIRSGSTIKYLGKQYRLKIEESMKNEIKLKGKFLIISTKKKEEEYLRGLLEDWYRHRASVHFSNISIKCLSKVSKYGIYPPNIIIRKMKSRWGSCIQKKQKIILNLNLIKESFQSIEYVIMHELCHLKYPYHNPQFYTFFSIVMPDWRDRKNKLDNKKPLLL